MKPQSAKAKGRKLQQLVRDAILKQFKHILEPDDVKSTSMGAGGEDVQLSPKARTVVPVAIECKSRRRIAVYRDYEQAQQHAGETSREPVVIIKENGKDPLAIIDLQYFLDLVADAYEHLGCYRKQQKELTNEARTSRSDCSLG